MLIEITGADLATYRRALDGHSTECMDIANMPDADCCVQARLTAAVADRDRRVAAKVLKDLRWLLCSDCRCELDAVADDLGAG